VLKIENLNVFYGKSQVLFDISLKVEKGEIVSVIGANNAGKSTLLKTIVGLVKSSSGSIFFMDKRTDGLPAYKITELGISLVPERRRLFDRMTVLENLQLGAYVRRARKNMEKNLRMAFDLFPILEERRNQLAGTLSGGEQQMLAIARGLMSDPLLLMLDEPSTGLAPKIVDKIFKTIKEIQQHGISILLVEQNAFMSLKISDRSYVIEQGKISLEGKSEKLLNDPRVKVAYIGI
jgi:branched-chain amino acid transport system ATP-binding protein